MTAFVRKDILRYVFITNHIFLFRDARMHLVSISSSFYCSLIILFPNYRFFDILSSFFSVLTSFSLNLALSKKVFLKYFSSLFHPKVDLWNKSFYLFEDILSQQAHFKANIGETVLSIFFPSFYYFYLLFVSLSALHLFPSSNY